MTPEEVERHNRFFQEALELAKGEISVGVRSKEPPGVQVRDAIERARLLFLRSLELNPANWSAMWFIGKIYQRLDDNESALSWFERASNVNGSQPDIAREASIAAMELGLSEKALLFAQQAEQLRPFDRGLKENLAIAFLLAGKPSEAKVVLDQAFNNVIDEGRSPLIAVIDRLISAGASPPRTLRELEQSYSRLR